MENFPFGYRHVLAPYEPEMSTVRYIKQLYLDKGLSQREIVRRLNSENLYCRGRKWHQGTVSKIIKRECAEQIRTKRIEQSHKNRQKPSWRDVARERNRTTPDV